MFSALSGIVQSVSGLVTSDRSGVGRSVPSLQLRPSDIPGSNRSRSEVFVPDSTIWDAPSIRIISKSEFNQTALDIKDNFISSFVLADANIDTLMFGGYKKFDAAVDYFVRFYLKKSLETYNIKVQFKLQGSAEDFKGRQGIKKLRMAVKEAVNWNLAKHFYAQSKKDDSPLYAEMTPWDDMGCAERSTLILQITSAFFGLFPNTNQLPPKRYGGTTSSTSSDGSGFQSASGSDKSAQDVPLEDAPLSSHSNSSRSLVRCYEPVENIVVDTPKPHDEIVVKRDRRSVPACSGIDNSAGTYDSVSDRDDCLDVIDSNTCSTINSNVAQARAAVNAARRDFLVPSGQYLQSSGPSIFDIIRNTYFGLNDASRVLNGTVVPTGSGDCLSSVNAYLNNLATANTRVGNGMTACLTGWCTSSGWATYTNYHPSTSNQIVAATNNINAALAARTADRSTLLGYSIVTSPPTSSPTTSPSTSPTTSPTTTPTISPTSSPTYSPSTSPSTSPTTSPTTSPSTSPTTSPTLRPTFPPTSVPTWDPSSIPTSSPTTFAPSLVPTTTSPTGSPTFSPSITVTGAPNFSPTQDPSDAPMFIQTLGPTGIPTRFPTRYESGHPTVITTQTPFGTVLVPTPDPTTGQTIHIPTGPPTGYTPTVNSTGSPSFIFTQVNGVTTAVPVSAPTSSLIGPSTTSSTPEESSDKASGASSLPIIVGLTLLGLLLVTFILGFYGRRRAKRERSEFDPKPKAFENPMYNGDNDDETEVRVENGGLTLVGSVPALHQAGSVATIGADDRTYTTMNNTASAARAIRKIIEDVTKFRKGLEEAKTFMRENFSKWPLPKSIDDQEIEKTRMLEFDSEYQSLCQDADDSNARVTQNHRAFNKAAVEKREADYFEIEKNMEACAKQFVEDVQDVLKKVQEFVVILRTSSVSIAQKIDLTPLIDQASIVVAAEYLAPTVDATVGGGDGVYAVPTDEDAVTPVVYDAAFSGDLTPAVEAMRSGVVVRTPVYDTAAGEENSTVKIKAAGMTRSVTMPVGVAQAPSSGRAKSHSLGFATSTVGGTFKKAEFHGGDYAPGFSPEARPGMEVYALASKETEEQRRRREAELEASYGDSAAMYSEASSSGPGVDLFGTPLHAYETPETMRGDRQGSSSQDVYDALPADLTAAAHESRKAGSTFDVNPALYATSGDVELHERDLEPVEGDEYISDMEDDGYNKGDGVGDPGEDVSAVGPHADVSHLVYEEPQGFDVFASTIDDGHNPTWEIEEDHEVDPDSKTLVSEVGEPDNTNSIPDGSDGGYLFVGAKQASVSAKPTPAPRRPIPQHMLGTNQATVYSVPEPLDGPYADVSAASDDENARIRLVRTSSFT